MNKPEKKEHWNLCNINTTQDKNCNCGAVDFNQALDDMEAWHKQALIDASISELANLSITGNWNRDKIKQRIAQLKKSMEGMK